MKTINVAILGASGYTGAELLRLLAAHPHVAIKALTADSQAGKKLEEVYPHLRFSGYPDLVTMDQVDFSGIDAVFCCLPHGTTQDVIAGLPSHVKIIDLSADFRLEDVASYATWYGHAHKAPALQKDAVYGLTELHRDAITKARLVANPGCYPSSIQLPLMPLLAAGIITTETLIADAKSGVTGAGRAAKQANLYSEIDGGISAYGIGAHRHVPEIEQGLSQAAGTAVTLSFTPHLMPMNRGILSTIYVSLAKGRTVEDIRATWHTQYEGETFVKILPPGHAPTTHQVRGTNMCLMNVFADRLENRAIIVCVIDNLVKGASGQAVQNFNLMFGFPEQTALTQTALFP